MDKSIRIRLINIKAFVFSSIILLIALSIVVFIAMFLKNTVNQTYFIIISLSLIGGINYLIIKKTSQLAGLYVKKDYISIILQKGEALFNSNTNDIKNYNIYYLILKKMGYVLRLKTNRNYYYWITWINFDKKDSEDDENYIKIKNALENKFKIKKISSFSDKFILALASLPWVILFIGILTFIGGIIYLMNV